MDSTKKFANTVLVFPQGDISKDLAKLSAD